MKLIFNLPAITAGSVSVSVCPSLSESTLKMKTPRPLPPPGVVAPKTQAHAHLGALNGMVDFSVCLRLTEGALPFRAVSKLDGANDDGGLASRVFGLRPAFQEQTRKDLLG